MVTKTGAEIIMEIMQNEGVEYVFGLPGATEVLFLDALEKQDKIKYILGLHEVVCLGAAEGYARTSGKVGVLNLHTHPGLAAATPLLVNAQRGGVPLLITAGQMDNRLLLQEPHLSGPLVETARPFTKWSAEVNHAEEIPIAFQRAFKIALQPPTGPVFLSLPQNVLAQKIDYEYTPSTRLPTRIRPDKDALYRAMDLLLNSKKPAILVTEGVARSQAVSEVVKLAELIGAPVYQAWMADVNFPSRHPQYLGEVAIPSAQMRKAMKSVDALVAIGCQLFEYTRYDPEPFFEPGCSIIQINDNPWEIAKNVQPAVAILADIKEALAELTSLYAKKMSPPDAKAAHHRIEEISLQRKQKDAELARRFQTAANDLPISVYRFTAELVKALKPGTLVVDDAWSSSEIIRQSLDLKEPGEFQRCRRGGSIGYGMTGPIGVQLAAPDRPVVAVVGDGSAAWSIQGLWTAARYNLPITFIILANRSYHTALLRWLDYAGGALTDKHECLCLDNPIMDFCHMAQGFGIHASRVEKPEDLGKALTKAFNSGKAELVEVVVKPCP